MRIEVGFDGGQMMSASSSPRARTRSSRRSTAPVGTFELEAEDGRYTVALARIVYVKRFAREGRVGFSGGRLGVARKGTSLARWRGKR